jgi:hypothetical protein
MSNNPREIPTKEDPNKSQPEKAPNKIPDAEPSKSNPRNPKEDK